MNLTCEYFENLVKDWFSGEKTVPEIIAETNQTLNIETYINQGYVFDYAFALALSDYSKEYDNLISLYLAEEDVVCLTVKGLQRNLEMLRDGLITKEQFLEWSSWSNIGCENSSLDIENNNIEYFCTIFILEYQFLLQSEDAINSLISIIKPSNLTSFGKFIIYIYLLIDEEKKSMYFFFRDFIQGKKNENDLNFYLIKKFNYNLPRFKYNLEIFPYLIELRKLKEEKTDVKKVMSLLEFTNA